MSDGRLETVLVEGRGVELPTAVHLPYHKQTTLGDWSVCPYICVYYLIPGPSHSRYRAVTTFLCGSILQVSFKYS